MKHLFLSVFISVFVFVGAGCATTISLQDKGVEGPWYLSFDLPSGWVMVKEYDSPREDSITPSQEISQNVQTVIVQSTEKAIVENGIPQDSVSPETYITSGYSMIRVDRLDSHRIIPSSAEDLKNGFSYAEGKYYYQNESGDKYQFVITTDGDDELVAREIILSAKVVTVYTGVTVPSVGDVQTTE